MVVKYERPRQLRLDWPTFITETRFFEAVDQLPKGKNYSFLSDR
jgi:hypothetical protein